MKAAVFALGALALSVTVVPKLSAQAADVDPEAVSILRNATDYLSSQQQFSVTARNDYEDVLPSGHRVDFGMEGTVTVSRPDKLRGERKDARMHQVLVFDGTTVTLFNPIEKVYASEAFDGTIEEMFAFAHHSLGLYIPLSDLIWSDVFPLLMEGVNFATIIGKDIVDGVQCDHLLFSRPGVDFQIWIPDSGPPLPRKYIVTDTETPQLLSIVSLLSEWNIAPDAADSHFTFVPPEGVHKIPFLRFDLDTGSNR